MILHIIAWLQIGHCRRWLPLAAALALCRTASAESWGGRAAIGNDAFTDVIPPLDDQGFTNDLALEIHHLDDGLALGGSIFHRMITASDFSRRRWDQLDLRATLAWRWRSAIELDAWLGPSFGGNFGGLAIQNTWHRWSGTGPTVNEGLQNDYPGDRRAGIVAGGRARGSIGGDLAGYGDATAQLALGSTGVTMFTIASGARAQHRWGGTTIGAHVELAVTGYHVEDPYLALPDGYRAGWQLEWRAGLDIAFGRYRISYEYRANEGGSGEPIGVVAFAW
ncbi:MAG: hypothetical protein E6J90_44180 [Deltaproteobacteria bacterium]|nr:MAG: hypothetical protein E6J91_43300 [Deltaproteobacteria bacterium]TMQ07192.1 MAG: hypothetical protein E6J90_44180 [Deltaproteobacteria bacterium]